MPAFVLDIDGTTLLGEEALPGAVAFVSHLREHSFPHVWVTNNTSRSRAGWLDRLARAGLDPRPQELYTAGDATIDTLLAMDPPPCVHLVGTEALAEDFRSAGLRLAASAEEAEIVVLGYDTSLTYEKVRQTAALLRRGLPYVATHPDATCPSPEGPDPDVGSFIALFEVACGRRPHVIGKPHVAMVEGALARLGAERDDVVVVGDRLATDVRMAAAAGLRSYLVLTGVTSAADVEGAAVPPSAVFADLAAVLEAVRGADEAGRQRGP